jgi:hypothetical protein
MSRLIVVTLIVTGFAAGATAAWGQDGNGLYEPFPPPAAKSAAQRYYDRAGLTIKGGDIDRGTFVHGMAAPAQAGDASHRAGRDVGGLGLAGMLAIGAVGLALAAGLARTQSTRRLPSAATHD